VAWLGRSIALLFTRFFDLFQTPMIIGAVWGATDALARLTFVGLPFRRAT
jgi:hypothetical protein